MNCPVDYDDDAERRATHPDLLPEDWRSVDPEIQAGNSKVLKKAVQLMSLIRQGANMPNHRRSVLEDLQRAGRAMRSARPAGRPSKVEGAACLTAPRRPLRQAITQATGGGKPAGGRRRSQDSVRRNKYVPALLLLHRIARHVRAS